MSFERMETDDIGKLKMMNPEINNSTESALRIKSQIIDLMKKR